LPIYAERARRCDRAGARTLHDMASHFDSGTRGVPVKSSELMLCARGRTGMFDDARNGQAHYGSAQGSEALREHLRILRHPCTRILAAAVAALGAARRHAFA